MASPLPDIFEFLDYREYLRACYTALKEHRRSFSYRAFAQKAGMSSPNFLKRVIDGQRNLGPKSIDKVAAALDLSTRETEFFRDLVGFTQAKTGAEKNEFFAKLGKDRKHRRVRKLERDSFTYLSHWYYPAIRELASCDGFIEDPQWIASHVQPPITTAQARKAVEVLLKLGFLVRGEDGTLGQGEALLSTGPEVRSLAIRNFHRQMIERATDALETIPLEEREISGTTVALSEDGFRLFKERIHALRAELLELSAEQKGPKRVIQFNFQAFPLADTGAGQK
jgi:uncharacterized protein (TIGR02147 family)